MPDKITKDKLVKHLHEYIWNLGTKKDIFVRDLNKLEGRQKFSKMMQIKEMEETLNGLKKVKKIVENWKE